MERGQGRGEGTFLTLACWVILHVFLSSFKINLFRKFFPEYNQSVKQFGSRSGPQQNRADVLWGPDLGPNCLQRLLDDTRLIS